MKCEHEESGIVRARRSECKRSASQDGWIVTTGIGFLEMIVMCVLRTPLFHLSCSAIAVLLLASPIGAISLIVQCLWSHYNSNVEECDVIQPILFLPYLKCEGLKIN